MLHWDQYRSYSTRLPTDSTGNVSAYSNSLYMLILRFSIPLMGIQMTVLINCRDINLQSDMYHVSLVLYEHYTKQEKRINASFGCHLKVFNISYQDQ
jgi:hypothetical protein